MNTGEFQKIRESAVDCRQNNCEDPFFFKGLGFILEPLFKNYKSPVFFVGVLRAFFARIRFLAECPRALHISPKSS